MTSDVWAPSVVLLSSSDRLDAFQHPPPAFQVWAFLLVSVGAYGHIQFMRWLRARMDRGDIPRRSRLWGWSNLPHWCYQLDVFRQDDDGHIDALRKRAMRWNVGAYAIFVIGLVTLPLFVFPG
jgi:hypothetical protein